VSGRGDRVPFLDRMTFLRFSTLVSRGIHRVELAPRFRFGFWANFQGFQLVIHRLGSSCVAAI